ncbi:MAG: hypothetical protein DME00_27805 [Candidatus Rokuibacteriota bacterium]|nr:MAG: hypothetical protein DME00_27805 [Candidatus Rokubacteria bacterium]PYO14515.1 MAG: hypothetical protein DMD75_04250 [Candidatus Rokubacteria bacterium]
MRHVLYLGQESAALCHLGLARIYRQTRDAGQAAHLGIAVKAFREMAMRFWLERTETVLQR